MKATGTVPEAAATVEYLRLAFENLDAEKTPKEKLALRFANRAKRLYKASKYKEALVAAERAVELERDCSWAHSIHAATLWTVNRIDEAISAATRAIELQPDSSWEHVFLSGALCAVGRYEEALAAADRAITLQPSSARAYCLQSTALFKFHRYEEALAAAERAIALQPENDVEAVTARQAALDALDQINNLEKRHNLRYIDNPPSPKSAVSQQPPVKEPSKDLDRLAGHLPEVARAPFKQQVSKVFEAASTIAEHGTAAGWSAAQIAAAIEDSTLFDRLDRFDRRLREIELPEGGFTTKEQAQAAAAFAKTFYDLQESEATLGLPLTEKPERVKQAEAMKSAYYRHHTETGEFVPPRPRGRPRRAPAPRANSTQPK